MAVNSRVVTMATGMDAQIINIFLFPNLEYVLSDINPIMAELMASHRAPRAAITPAMPGSIPTTVVVKNKKNVP